MPNNPDDESNQEKKCPHGESDPENCYECNSAKAESEWLKSRNPPWLIIWCKNYNLPVENVDESLCDEECLGEGGDNCKHLTTVEFLPDQVEVLRGLLVLPCCHTSGEHDPTHYIEGRYICYDQKAKAWERIVEALKIEPQIHSESNCWWCRNYPAKKDVQVKKKEAIPQ